MNNNIKVSVIMTTYNHESFIQQAILSAAHQKTDFRYEILIGEDASSDGTRQIVRELTAKYPDLIRPFYNSRDDVIFINGRATGRWNFINLMKHARGEHIAILEGDDYWIDENKLQKQVNYLNTHPNCSVVFHNVRLDNPSSGTQYEVQHPLNFRKTSSIADLLSKNFIPTCSVLYRNNLVDKLPQWFFNAPTGDWPLHIINASNGSIDYIPDVMGVYRQHEHGFWGSVKNNTSTVHLYNLQFYQLIKEDIPEIFLPLLNKYLCKTYYQLIQDLTLAGDLPQRDHSKKSLKHYCEKYHLNILSYLKISILMLLNKSGLNSVFMKIKAHTIHKIRYYWWLQYKRRENRSQN